LTRYGTAPGWLVQTATAIAVIGSVTAVSADLASAQAAPAVTKRATVVKIVTRKHFGKILATIHGRALYIKPHGGCTGSCLTIWPPLLMPKGKTIPVGTRCLGTARRGHRLQVTYRGKRLYKFVNDSGKSVRGNNVDGFKVAKLVRRACPM
jgi:predicted lipoprotein with Yx(FWY)xxD motif